jgi:hypothetical protein
MVSGYLAVFLLIWWILSPPGVGGTVWWRGSWDLFGAVEDGLGSSDSRWLLLRAPLRAWVVAELHPSVFALLKP